MLLDDRAAVKDSDKRNALILGNIGCDLGQGRPIRAGSDDEGCGGGRDDVAVGVVVVVLGRQGNRRHKGSNRPRSTAAPDRQRPLDDVGPLIRRREAEFTPRCVRVVDRRDGNLLRNEPVGRREHQRGWIDVRQPVRPHGDRDRGAEGRLAGQHDVVLILLGPVRCARDHESRCIALDDQDAGFVPEVNVQLKHQRNRRCIVLQTPIEVDIAAGEGVNDSRRVLRFGQSIRYGRNLDRLGLIPIAGGKGQVRVAAIEGQRIAVTIGQLELAVVAQIGRQGHPDIVGWLMREPDVVRVRGAVFDGFRVGVGLINEEPACVVIAHRQSQVGNGDLVIVRVGADHAMGDLDLAVFLGHVIIDRFDRDCLLSVPIAGGKGKHLCALL